jgi:hypothetical protein
MSLLRRSRLPHSAGPERFLSSFWLFVELVRALGPEPSDAGAVAIGRPTARIMTLRRAVALCRRDAAKRREPALQAALVKDPGTLVEQEIPELARQLVDAEPDANPLRHLPPCWRTP